MLSHRNLIVGAESVSSYLRNTAGRRHPVRPAAQLRRGLQPGHDRLRGRGARRAAQPPRRHRHPAAGRQAPRDGADRRAAAVAADHRHQLAGGRGATRCATSPTPAAGCRGPPSTGCAPSSPGALPYLMYGLTESFRSTYLDPAEVDRRPDSIGKAIPDAEILVVRPDGTPVRAGRARRAGPPRRARRARLLGGRGQDRRAVQAGPRLAPRLARAGAGGLLRRHRRRRRGGLPLLRRPQRRDDQDLGLPGEPDRGRGGRVRHRAGRRRGRARRARRAARATRSRWSSRRPRAPSSSPRRSSTALRSELPLYMVPSRVVVRASMPRSPNGKYDRPLVREELLA